MAIRRGLLSVLVLVPLLCPDPIGAACVGDCNGDGDVTVNELVSMVNIALETTPVSQCRNGDANGDGTITVAEIVTAVTKALNGCLVDVSGTWAQSETVIESSTCAAEVNELLQEEIDSGGFDCLYTVTQNGHQLTVREDCGDGEIATSTATVDDAGMVTATDTETETIDNCKITQTTNFSADASVSPTTVHGSFDFRFSSKCGLANCGLVLRTTWTRVP
jgi:hypothetical protein